MRINGLRVVQRANGAALAYDRHIILHQQRNTFEASRTTLAVPGFGGFGPVEGFIEVLVGERINAFINLAGAFDDRIEYFDRR